MGHHLFLSQHPVTRELFILHINGFNVPACCMCVFCSILDRGPALQQCQNCTTPLYKLILLTCLLTYLLTYLLSDWPIQRRILLIRINESSLNTCPSIIIYLSVHSIPMTEINATYATSVPLGIINGLTRLQSATRNRAERRMLVRCYADLALIQLTAYTVC